MDVSGRPYQAWYRPITTGTPEGGRSCHADRLLLQTESKCSLLRISLSRDEQYVIITISGRLSSEVNIQLQSYDCYLEEMLAFFGL